MAEAQGPGWRRGPGGRCVEGARGRAQPLCSPATLAHAGREEEGGGGGYRPVAAGEGQPPRREAATPLRAGCSALPRWGEAGRAGEAVERPHLPALRRNSLLAAPGGETAGPHLRAGSGGAVPEVNRVR